MMRDMFGIDYSSFTDGAPLGLCLGVLLSHRADTTLSPKLQRGRPVLNYNAPLELSYLRRKKKFKEFS